MKRNDLKGDIIRAGFKAFAKADYQHVSTNQIVEDARVSKGLLFHYFKSKPQLYLALYETAWNIIHRDTFEGFPFADRDVFQRLKALVMRKSEAMHKHKTLTAFIKRVHMHTANHDIVKARVNIYQQFQQRNYKRVFDDIDTTAFRNREYLDEIYKIVTWTFTKIHNDWERVHASKENADALKILENELVHYTTFFKAYFYQ